MLRRIIWFPIALVSAILLVTLAVANREPVRLVLDPFRPEAPVLSIQLPFYAYLLGALTLGVILGGVATWMTQGRWRRTARVKSQDAMRWQAEADRLSRERDATVGATRQLGIANGTSSLTTKSLRRAS
ncbi:MAG: LapA family protein [Hyphomicrobiaceae bacterium]